jgi:uncharacterized protein with NRDE domain
MEPDCNSSTRKFTLTSSQSQHDRTVLSVTFAEPFCCKKTRYPYLLCARNLEKLIIGIYVRGPSYELRSNICLMCPREVVLDDNECV